MKLNKYLLFLLPIFLCITSCESNTTNSGEEDNTFKPMVYEHEQSLGDNKIIINGFESNKDLDSMMALNYFGKVELDSSIKHNGDKSAKVTLLNQNLEDSTVNNPTLCQSMFNVSRDIYETDATDIKYIKMWVYNPNELDYRIGMRPIIRSTYDWIGGPVLPTKWITVNANSWTEISYEVNLAIIPEVSASINGENDGKVVHFLPAMYLVFSRPEGEESDRIFYLDDFYIEKKESEVSL